MVIKVSDNEMDNGNRSKLEKSKKSSRKRSLKGTESTTPAATENDGHEVEAEKSEVETKKSKPDVDEAVLAYFANCDLALESAKSTLTLKLNSLTDLLQSILEKNVNTVLIKTDFTTWIKNALLNILKDTLKSKVSTQLFNCLSIAVKVAPTVFESVLENVLVVCYFHPKTGPDVQASIDLFMCELVHTFEKLRRFPKFIAKLLCCIRDNLNPDNKVSGAILSRSFAETIGPVISSLTVGQVIDLWKTLQHNLEIECVKPLESGTESFKTNAFFCIVTDIFAEFLSNVKVADYTIPDTTVDKISEMIVKLKDDCLKPLGTFLSKKKNVITEMMKPFLNLAYAYGQLHFILLCYNSKYQDHKPSIPREIKPTPTDLSFVHPYLSSDGWIALSNCVLKYEDSSMTELLVNLVAQKLKFMTALEQKNIETSGAPDSSEIEDKKGTEEGAVSESKILFQSSKQEHLKQAADFIWTHQNKVSTELSDETLTFVAQHIEPRKMIELAGTLVKQLHEYDNLNKATDSGIQVCGTSSYDLPTSLLATENSMFHYALILECLAEIMRRVQKMKLQPKAIKKILTDVMSVESRIALIKGNSFTKMSSNKSTQVKCFVTENLLFSVNEILTSVALKLDKAATTPTQKMGDEFSGKLITGMLQFLSSLNFETYPKDVKTVIFLCSTTILIALVEQDSDDDIFAPVARIVATAGSQSQGNETLFSIHWIPLFKWFRSNVNRFESNVQLDLCNMILSNVYVSPKVVKEFEEEIQTMCEFVDFESSMAHVALISLEFLLKELQGIKTKLISQLQDHSRRLVQFIVKKLNETDIQTASNFYRACWVSQLAIDVMDESTLDSYKKSVSSKIKMALKFLKTAKTLSDKTIEDQVSASYAVKFLYAIIKSRTKLEDSLSKDVLGKVWKSCVFPIIVQNDGLPHARKSLMPKQFVKHLLEAANVDEFKVICDSIEHKLSDLSIHHISKYAETSMVIQILSDLVDAEVGSDCKTARRHTIQECLHKFLLLSIEWTSRDSSCLNTIVIPCIQFQTKLLRRRGAMVNLKTLAVCLTSVTSVQMNVEDINDISTFRTLFCTLAELLNAFAVHRLDVVAFRSHVYLQCFQYLIEVLTKRADQKNKLMDDEILALRTCAYTIERLCKSMKLGQKEFSRVSPYFIATLVRQFELLTIYPAVKVPLLGGCHKLLDLCDDHGVALLNSLLTVGSKEILKTIYEQYKKYYQYKGRV